MKRVLVQQLANGFQHGTIIHRGRIGTSGFSIAAIPDQSSTLPETNSKTPNSCENDDDCEDLISRKIKGDPRRIAIELADQAEKAICDHVHVKDLTDQHLSRRTIP